MDDMKITTAFLITLIVAAVGYEDDVYITRLGSFHADLSTFTTIKALSATHGQCDVVKDKKIYKDCEDAFQQGETDDSKSYLIMPYKQRYHRVKCLFDGYNGWTFVSNRFDGSTDFRNGLNYHNGFGDIKKEFWAGNIVMYNLRLASQSRSLKLSIKMETHDDQILFANYSSFQAYPWVNFNLQASGYSGTAGDSLSQLNGNQMYARNKINFDMQTNCTTPNAVVTGDWWIGCDYTSNLNGQWYPTETVPAGGAPGLYWGSWKNASYSLKAVQILVGRDD